MDTKPMQGRAREQLCKCPEEYKTDQCVTTYGFYLCPQFGAIARFVKQTVLSHADGSWPPQWTL